MFMVDQGKGQCGKTTKPADCPERTDTVMEVDGNAKNVPSTSDAQITPSSVSTTQSEFELTPNGVYWLLFFQLTEVRLISITLQFSWTTGATFSSIHARSLNSSISVTFTTDWSPLKTGIPLCVKELWWWSVRHYMLSTGNLDECDYSFPSLYLIMMSSLQIYQINAHTIKVLHPSTLDTEVRKQTVLPTTTGISSTSTCSAAASAISNVHLGKHEREEA